MVYYSKNVVVVVRLMKSSTFGLVPEYDQLDAPLKYLVNRPPPVCDREDFFVVCTLLRTVYEELLLTIWNYTL